MLANPEIYSSFTIYTALCHIHRLALKFVTFHFAFTFMYHSPDFLTAGWARKLFL